MYRNIAKFTVDGDTLMVRFTDGNSFIVKAEDIIDFLEKDYIEDAEDTGTFARYDRGRQVIEVGDGYTTRTIHAPYEIVRLIHKFNVNREESFSLDYCKHLRDKYSVNEINVFFSASHPQKVQVIEYIREVIAPRYSKGQEGCPMAIVYHHADGMYHAHIIKDEMLKRDEIIPEISEINGVLSKARKDAMEVGA